MKKLLLIMFFALAGFSSFAKSPKVKSSKPLNMQCFCCWCNNCISVDLNGASMTEMIFNAINTAACGSAGPCC